MIVASILIVATNNLINLFICFSGGIGQPLSLLLKKNDLISHLSLYDIVNTPGVAADLSHINTNSKVKNFGYNYQLPLLPRDSNCDRFTIYREITYFLNLASLSGHWICS